MQFFYSSEINPQSTTYSFSKEERKHIVKVLRKSVNDTLYIINGKGWKFTGKIIIITQNTCTVSIVSKTFEDPKNYNLHLAVAPTKMNDRFEWFLEKATEIGIHSITPIICDHSERKVIKIERFKRILQSAMKQSLSLYLPHLHEATSFNAFVSQQLNGQLYIAHCEPSNKTALKNIISLKQDIVILIGPEGDFSKKEIALALQKNYKPVSLGNTRLRTETAAIVACHTAALMHQ